MPVKPKSAVKSKSASKTKPAVKKKSTVKPNKKSISKQNDLSQLSEDIISNVGVGIYIMQHGKFIFASPLYQRLTGYSATEIIGHNSFDHVHPDDKAMVRTKAIKSLKGKSHSYEYRFIRKNGDEMWILEMVTSIIYKGEHATLGSFMDITERKHMEETMRQSEEKYRGIIENIHDGYFEIDLAGNYIFVNDSLCEIHGYPKKKLMGTNNRQYADKENAKKAFEAFNKIYETGKSGSVFDYEIIRKDGTKRQIEVSASLKKDSSGKPIGFRGLARQITERKRMEDKLRQSEEKYRLIIEGIEDGYAELDLNGKITFFNKALPKIVGYPEDELEHLDIHNRQYVDEETAKYLQKIYNNTYATGKSEKDIRYEVIAKDGTKRNLDGSVSLIRDTTGQPMGFRGIVRDRTESRQAEETLRRSEEKYRTIIETIQDGYFEIDLNGKYTFVNNVICDHYKRSKEELIGMDNRQYQNEANAKKAYQVFKEIYTTGNPVKAFEMEVIRKDDTIQISEVSISLMRDSEGKPIGFRGVSRDVTERKQHEEELSLLRSAMDVSQDMIFLVDRTTMRFLYANETALRLTGYTREEYIKLSPQDMLLVDRKTLEDAYDAAIAAAPAGITVEMRSRTKDGTRTIIELHRRALNIGNRWIIATIMQDTSRRWLAEESMRLLGRMFAALSATNETILHAKSPEELYQRVCDAAVEGGKFITTGVLLFDPGTTWVRVAAASGTDTDRLREARISLDEAIPEGRGLVGTAFRTSKPCVSNDYRNDVVSLAWRENVKNVGSVAVVPLLRDGQVIGALIFYATEKRAFDGEIIKLLERMAENVVFALDNFEHEANRKRAEEKIQYMATHDALTGLPNRLMFSELLNHAIRSAQRHQRQLAIFFIDLDRFKTINDSLGHAAGDQLLQEIALRFKQSLRAVDVVGRLGGDEFVILIEEISDSNQVATVAHKILTAAIKPIVLLGEECRVTASIGISMYPKDAEDEQDLMKNADIAMYLAKEEGKNNYQFYSEDIQSKSIERLSIETNLRFALERNELSLHYQAKVDFKTNAITGVEALLRWQNPYLGSVTPTQFIPVAEESWLIIPIGRWVIRTACAQNVAWQREGLPPVCMAVNLSPRQLMDEFLVEDIQKALNDSGMAPNLLELEITESMVMHNPTRMIAVLAKIKNLGVRLAIDDFGTGYSSLAQIKHFPIDTLKVDRSFIRNIPQDSEDKAITEAIIAMGKTLSLTVVAEGVETQEQEDFLREHSCDEMQGFYFSKPIAPDQFAELLRKHVPSPQK